MTASNSDVDYANLQAAGPQPANFPPPPPMVAMREFDATSAIAGITGGRRRSRRQYRASSRPEELEGVKKVRELGRGSEAVVWLVEIGKGTFAAKWPKTPMTDFSREISSTAKIAKEEKNLLLPERVMPFGFSNVIIYPLMRSDLEAYFAENLELSVETILDYMFQMCSAIQVICQRYKIVHLDVKPENFLLTHDRRVVKLSDFGMTRQIGFSVKEDAGTVAYLAPEYFGRRSPADPKADVYALGTTYFKLLANSLPFAPDASTNEMVLAQRKSSVASCASFEDLTPTTYIRQIFFDHTRIQSEKLFSLICMAVCHPPTSRCDAEELLRQIHDIDDVITTNIQENDIEEQETPLGTRPDHVIIDMSFMDDAKAL